MNGTDTSPGLPPSGAGRGSRGGGILRPPADRPAWARGPRAWLAYVTVVAAALVLVISRSADPGWTEPVLKAAAATLLLAAGLLWVARRPLTVTLGVALVPLATGACVLAFAARENGRRAEQRWGGSVVTFRAHGRTRALTEAELRSVPAGATRAEVRRILGPPIGHGIQRVVDARDLRCLAYPSQGFDPDRGGHVHAFCFQDGRLVARRTW